MIPSEFAGHPTPYRVARDAGYHRARVVLPEPPDRWLRDGDTVALTLDLGFSAALTLWLRLGDLPALPFDTPEMVGAEAAAGREAKAAARAWLIAHPFLLVRTSLLLDGSAERRSADRYGARLWDGLPTGAGEALDDHLTGLGLNKLAPGYKYRASP